jgi:TPR repeat protein
VIEKRSKSSKLNPWFAVALCLFAGSLSAGSPALDQALKKYYAGYPREAIGMIEPLAVSGNVEAQYLLGNLLYTLTQSGRFDVQGDPVKWYRLAAAQGSARAAYALGAIYNNRWLQARRDEDLHQAESFYRQALDLGDEKARTALDKLATHKKTRGETTSLTYTNASFDSKRQQQPNSQPAPQTTKNQELQTATLADILASLQGVEDSSIDTQKLKALLSQVNDAEQAEASGAAMATLKQMLGGFETNDQLFADLLKLIGYLEAASKLDTAPGSN